MIQDLLIKLKSFGSQCLRVWHVLRKPNATEFKGIAKISALGMLAIGLLGFLVTVIMSYFK